MKLLMLLAVLGGLAGATPECRAQPTRFQTRTGTVSFFSSSPLEDIEARSQQTTALVALNTGEMAFNVPIRSFQFRRTLMQEHFNENYLESEKYPKATFTGRLLDWQPAALAATGQPLAVVAEGDLTIHGVTRRVRVPGTLTLSGTELQVQAQFTVAPADYNIVIPALVRGHIAKNVLVTVRMACAPAPGATAASHP